MTREYLINEDSKIYMKPITEHDLIPIKAFIDEFKAKVNRGLEFEKEYGVSMKKLIAYGDTKKLSFTLLKNIIPTLPKNPMHPRPVHGAYHCYVMKEPTMVIHETIYESWNCLLEMSGNPEYALIYSK